MSYDFDDDDFYGESNDGVYIIKSIDFFFLLTVNVIHAFQDQRVYDVKCVPTWSKTNSLPEQNSFCVELMVEVYPDRRPSTLEILTYREDCSLGGPLTNKIGTEQMLMSTLAFASKKFGQNVFGFTDASRKIVYGIEVPLQQYGLLTVGTTWYQRAFGATPTGETSSNIQKYRDVLETRITHAQVEALRVVLQGPESLLSEKSSTKFMNILNRNEGSTWKETLQAIDRQYDGVSFFSFDVVEEIQRLLQLEDANKWEIEITPERVSKFLIAARKIY